MNVTRYRSGGASPDKPYRYDEITGNAYMPIRASTIQRTVDSHACARTCNVTAVAIEDLPRIFVVERLHDHQCKAITTATAGRDVMLVSPTGSGKSLAFWSAGLIRGGVTLVVSPLRSLLCMLWLCAA